MADLEHDGGEAFFAMTLRELKGHQVPSIGRSLGRVLGGLGHRMRLIPPQYPKPFVKQGKNDHIDAEPICEGAKLRPCATCLPAVADDSAGDWRKSGRI